MEPFGVNAAEILSWLGLDSMSAQIRSKQKNPAARYCFNDDKLNLKLSRSNRVRAQK